MQPTLDDLIILWQEKPERTPEELCVDCPDLLVELRDRIAILKHIEALANAQVVNPSKQNNANFSLNKFCSKN